MAQEAYVQVPIFLQGNALPSPSTLAWSSSLIIDLPNKSYFVLVTYV
jgi:hypothetical protein